MQYLQFPVEALVSVFSPCSCLSFWFLCQCLCVFVRVHSQIGNSVFSCSLKKVWRPRIAFMMISRCLWKALLFSHSLFPMYPDRPHTLPFLLMTWSLSVPLFFFYHSPWLHPSLILVNGNKTAIELWFIVLWSSHYIYYCLCQFYESQHETGHFLTTHLWFDCVFNAH